MRKAIVIRSIFIVFPLVLVFLVKSPNVYGATDINEKIEIANPYETIYIEAGVYNEPIEVNKPLTLIAEEGTLIQGNQDESLLRITGDEVSVSGFQFEQQHETNSHMRSNEPEPVVQIEDAADFTFVDNHLRFIGSGIRGNNSPSMTITGNEFNGQGLEQRAHGLGAVELYASDDVFLADNHVTNAVDGFYLDSLSGAVIEDNVVTNSRYATHLMFSSNVYGTRNQFEQNVNGLMIMDAENAHFEENVFNHQYDWNGFGVMIYNSKGITIEKNEISRNNVGVYIEDTIDTSIKKNLITGNQMALTWSKENKGFTFSENRVISNILSTYGNQSASISLDDGVVGNYWDEQLFRPTNDNKISSVPFEARSFYDRLLEGNRENQFLFESPGVSLWTAAEKWLPAERGTILDRFPLSEAGNAVIGTKDERETEPLFYLISAMFLLSIPSLLLILVRK
ncbi:right-handed parallel beta-helix repeat-containing protein [Shouchella sp. 1P09AA]|uniref:right-handed parallel beta-helix repeat-containing protein n=1 Tax=unclassified Shouchella TaxID=2893065 RepID=UPI0039A13CEC